MDDEHLSLYLNATQIVASRAFGIIDSGPDLLVEVEDNGKTNIFVKGLAAVQLLWFGTRCAVQLARKRPMTQLELSTFKYATCALIFYTLPWYKPQAVEIPIRHRVPVCSRVRPATEQDVDILSDFGGMVFLKRNFTPPFGMDNKRHDPRKRTLTDISNSVFAIFGSPRRGCKV